jgi:hypothetical protein
LLRSILPLPGNNAHWQEPSLPTLQHNLPTLGDIVPQLTPTPPTLQHIWPKPLLMLQLPVDAAPPQALRVSSSLACIANVQERLCVAVIAKSGVQAGCGGGGGNAIGRWFGRLPSIGQEQCTYTSRRMTATTTRPHAQAHNISMLHCTTATTTMPRAQVHDIYMLRRTTAMTTRTWLQQQHLLSTSPFLFHINVA